MSWLWGRSLQQLYPSAPMFFALFMFFAFLQAPCDKFVFCLFPNGQLSTISRTVSKMLLLELQIASSLHLS